MYIIANKIISRIYGHGRGWCFSPKNFLDLGSPGAIRINLHRFEKKGIIRRLARGLYDYPRKHPRIGYLPPNPLKIAEAFSIRDGIRLQPSGAYAANSLGLSEQVPATIVFLTDGPQRRLKIGHQEILLKRTTPRNLIAAGRTSGTLIQALKYIGKEQIRKYHIDQLNDALNSQAKAQLKKDGIYAPYWMHPYIEEIVDKSNV
jgi:hypothetical protein